MRDDSQEDSLTATSTPREAFDFSARLRLPPTVTAAERKIMVDEMIRILHLENCADTMIGNELIKGISGGEKKRVSIGVELITQPSILFLDEPTSGLDPLQLKDIRTLIKSFGQERTVILSTHIMQEVEAMCDRVIMIKQGRIVTDAPLKDILAQGGLEETFNTLAG